jgi:hypothetical protein
MSHRVLKDEMPKEQSLFNIATTWMVAAWQQMQSTRISDEEEAETRRKFREHPKLEDRRAHAQSIFFK